MSDLKKLSHRFQLITAQQINDHDRQIVEELEKARNFVLQNVLPRINHQSNPIIDKAVRELNQTLEHILQVKNNQPNS